MSESNFKHEYLFVLGNGASIASANLEWDNHLKLKPSLGNIIPILEEIDELDKKSPFKLSDLMDESHFEALKGVIKKVIEISGRKRERNIVRLFEALKWLLKKLIKISGRREERNIVRLLEILEEDSAKKWNQRNDLGLQERTYRSVPIWNDIGTLENAIYHLVAAYYNNYERKYFEKLWQLVQENHSPVISLNWDINFERVIQEKNPSIPMANYYGKYIFNLLPSDQKKGPYCPLVNILKPHGSLNWLIPTGAQVTLGNPSMEFGQVQPGSHLRVVDNLPANFNSEYQCFLIPPVSDKVAVNEYSGLFWKIKEAIWNDLSEKIREYAVNSRTLVIIGYSFPPEDEHIRKLLEKNHFEKVRVFDTSEAVYKCIKGYFPDAQCELKEGGFAEIMEWPDVGEGFKPSRSE